MRPLGLSILLMTLAVPARAQQSTERWAPLDRLAQRLVDGGWIPGTVLAVVDRDHVLHELAIGKADIQSGRPVERATPFYIASSTKSFTALAAALMADRGDWRLDDPIAKHLPRATWHAGVDPGTISLEALLSHTSGMASDGPVVIRAAYTGDIDHGAMLRSLAFQAPDPRGRGFRYSNLGYNIVSLAMDERGTPWQDVLRNEVFVPPGLEHTTARMSDVPEGLLAMPHGLGPAGLTRYPAEKSDRTMHAAGGIVTTIDDLARWVRVQLGDGMLDGRQVFPAGVIRDTHHPRSNFQLDFLEIRRVGYGLGWYTGLVGADTLIHHFGGFAGYAAHVSFKPSRGIGVAVMVNGGQDVESMELLAELAYALAADDRDGVARWEAAADSSLAAWPERLKAIGADRARRAARPQQLPLPLEAYVGRYHSDALGDLRIGRWGDRLRLVLGQVESTLEGYDVAKQQVRFEISAGSGTVGTFVVAGGRVTAFETNGMRFDRVGV